MSTSLSKLDLLSFENPVTCLGLPLSGQPYSVTRQDGQIDTAGEEIMAHDLQLLEQLDAVLTATNLDVRPVDTDVAKPSTSSILANSLVSRNPHLLHYGVDVGSEEKDNDAVDTTPRRPSAMAVSAHNSQLDPSGTSGVEEASGVSTAKKKKRREPRQESYMMMGDEAVAAAAKLSSFLELSVAMATGCAPGDCSEGGNSLGKVADGCGRSGRRSKQQQRGKFCLEVLKDLHGQLLTAQTQGYLQQVPHTLLHRLLLALHGTAELGLHHLLSEDTEFKSPPLARVTTALEAMLCELVIYTSSKLPPSLHLEELLGCAVDLTVYQLKHNVLAMHDVRFSSTYRSTGADDDVEEVVKASSKGPRARITGSSMSGRQAPRWTAVLVGQLERGISLLAQVMALVRMDADRLITLVRVLQQALAVSSLQTLHYQALGLTVSMFKYYPAHRETVLDKVVEGIVSYPNVGKQLVRCFQLQTLDNTVNIQMSAALVMQLIQVAAELPQLDASLSDALMPAKLPAHWSDHFWRAIMGKLSITRTSKTDTSADLKSWVESFVEDLLVALPLPEWPAAAVLLRRLICIIRKDNMSSEPGMQLVCIELLGMMARRLYILAKEVEEPEALRTVTSVMDAVLAADGEKMEVESLELSEVAQELLMEHLATNDVLVNYDASSCSSGAKADTSVAGSARQLIACNMLLAHAKAVERKHGHKLDDEHAKDAILRYRQAYERQRSCLGASTSGFGDLNRETAIMLSRWLVVKSVLGCSRSTLLSWLAEASGNGRTQKEAYAAAARAKAVKLLGGAIEVDTQVLNLPEVQVGIKGALHDDSVLVREATLDLIGRHISRSNDLAAQFYDVLAHAATDTGLTVRKRAVRLLWECCVRCPEFERRIEALLIIVSRVTDTEDAMRSLVKKICAEIWFLPHFQVESEDGSAQVSRGPGQRASQLGEVVMAIYCRMGTSMTIPFHAATPIVVMIQTILGEEGKAEFREVRQGAREVVDWLLTKALELQGVQDALPPSGPPGRLKGPSPSEELFQCLMALHVLCVADVKLLHRPEDPHRAIRYLAPYIKELPSGPNDLAGRRKAEQLLAVLAIVGGYISSLRHLDDKLANEITQDLRNIIFRVSHVQAVTVACQCLCAMAGLKPAHRNTVRQEASTYYNFLENDCKKKVTSHPEKQRVYPRMLYTLGTLCRYGADVLDEEPEGSRHPTCAAAMDLVLRFYKLLGDNVRAKETALQALGFIFIARPQLAVNVREVGPVLDAALDGTSPASIKARCLSSLTDLLRSEEDVLLARQAAARQEAEAAQQASTLPDTENRALARRNGEGDSSSVSSGIIQMLWEKILALATDTTPAPVPNVSGQTPPPTPTGTASAHGTVVRRRALELIEVVIRGGIVVPWEALPALCALATDPEHDNASRALAGLRAVVSANTPYVAGQVPRGVTEAYVFHCKLAALERPGQAPEPDKCRTLVQGLSSVWTTIFQPDKALKSKFLTALLKPLDEGCSLAGGTAIKADPHLLSFMTYIVAELPYRKMDELLAVLVRINEIISRRAEEVMIRFQELREAARPAKEADMNYKHSASLMPSAHSAVSFSNGSGNGLAAVVKASVTLSLLLLLKQYLRLSYDVTAERIAKYEPTGQQRKVEEKCNAVHNGKLRFNASKLRIDLAARASGVILGIGASAKAAKTAATLAAAGAGGVAGVVSVLDAGVEEVYKVLKTLIKQDEVDYKQGTHGPEVFHGAADVSPGKDDLRDVAINLEDIMAAPDAVCGLAKKPPLPGRVRGRPSLGRRTPRRPESMGRSRGHPPPSAAGASTSTKRINKRKRIAYGSEDSESSEEEDDRRHSADEAEEVRQKSRVTKRRLSKAL